MFYFIFFPINYYKRVFLVFAHLLAYFLFAMSRKARKFEPEVPAFTVDTIDSLIFLIVRVVIAVSENQICTTMNTV